MLPEMIHPHDRKWIIEQFNKIPAAYFERALHGYDTVYQEAFDNEPLPHKKENAGRRAANTRLREFIERFRLQS